MKLNDNKKCTDGQLLGFSVFIESDGNGSLGGLHTAKNHCASYEYVVTHIKWLQKCNLAALADFF